MDGQTRSRTPQGEVMEQVWLHLPSGLGDSVTDGWMDRGLHSTPIAKALGDNEQSLH